MIDHGLQRLVLAVRVQALSPRAARTGEGAQEVGEVRTFARAEIDDVADVDPGVLEQRDRDPPRGLEQACDDVLAGPAPDVLGRLPRSDPSRAHPLAILSRSNG